MLKKFFFLHILLASGLFYMTQAHLVKTSLSIKGGESFIAGETVIIKWDIMINHNVPHRIYFSPASGGPWQLIDSVPETSGKKAMSYAWIVPDTATTSSRIKIFQSFVSTPGEQTDDYTLVSKEFTITRAPTPVIRSSDKRAAIASKRVTVGWYDLNGRITAGPPSLHPGNRKGIARRIVAARR